MKIHDITRPLQNTLAEWPGDTPFNFRLIGRMDEGFVVNVGAMTMGLHNGTHLDAPFHYVADGEKIDEMPPELFIGRAVVADVTAAGWSIERRHLAHIESELARTPRLLLKTVGWLDSTKFPEEIPTLHPEVPEWLGSLGVKIVGVDVPSVDGIHSKTLPIHAAMAAAGIYIIESLDLSRVAGGTYEMVAMPLRIVGGDASPVRVILRETDA